MIINILAMCAVGFMLIGAITLGIWFGRFLVWLIRRFG